MELNEIAWFFYWADVIPKVGSAAGIISILLFIMGAAACFVSWVITLDETHPNLILPLIFTVILVVIEIVFVTISVMIPSSDTIYKMGVSIIGERIIELEEIREVGGEIGDLASETIDMLRSHIRNNTLN